VKYRAEWETYQNAKTDTARALYRKRFKEAAYSQWRDDFRRANPNFDKWLVGQEYNKPLARKAISRIGRARIAPISVFAGFSGVSPRRTAISYPKFKKPRILTGIRVRAPSAPGV